MRKLELRWIHVWSGPFWSNRGNKPLLQILVGTLILGLWSPLPASADDNISHLIVILQNQLLKLEPNNARASPAQSISRFLANQAEHVGDMTWTWSIPASTIVYQAGLNRFTILPKDFNLGGTRTDVDLTSTFSTRHEASNLFGKPLVVGLRGANSIAKCEFDFVTNPTCFPEVDISNVSTTDGDTPSVVFQVSDGNGTPHLLPAGNTIKVDRSNGPVSIILQPVTSSVIRSVGVSITLNRGPSIDISGGLSLHDRRQTYDEIVALQEQLGQAIAAVGDPDQALKTKTLNTAIHIISAELVAAKYPDIAKAFLLSRAKDIADLDQRVVDIRNLVIASNELTPAQLDLLVTRINVLLATPNLPDLDALSLIRDQLVQAKAAASAASNAVQVVRANFETSIDRMVKEYQAFVLEYAQYVTNDELTKLLDGASRTAILSKVAPSDSLIANSALGGRGAAVRASFGLPASR